VKSKFIWKKLDYNGEQLRSHFAYKSFSISGDCIIGFIGACDVNKNMVDIEDSKARKYIKSDDMVHFIVEHFGIDLERAILRQIILISIIKECIDDYCGRLILKRSGNDLYFGDKKLSVSIATSSPVSCLIHVGINILESGAPIPIVGLKRFKINAKKFANKVMKKYLSEMDHIAFARCKVEAVK